GERGDAVPAFRATVVSPAGPRGSTGARSRSVAPFRLPHRLHRGPLRVVRVAPQRVDEDADGATSRAHVFDLSARQPVVDGPPADAHELTRLHDRNRFSFHLAVASERLYRPLSAVGLGFRETSWCQVFDVTSCDPCSR